MYPPFHHNLLLAAPGIPPGWTSTLTHGLGLQCALIASACVVILAVALRAMLRLSAVGPRGASWRQRFAALRRQTQSESGTATVEFLLVFVISLPVCLILLQTVFIFTGNLYVQFAAFAATRSAIVQIPANRDLQVIADPESEGTGMFWLENNESESSSVPTDSGRSDRTSLESAQRAAAFAMMPVSGKSDASSGARTAFVRGLGEMFDAYNTSSPVWVDPLTGARLAYALQHTALKALDTPTFDDALELGGYLGPRDPVTLEVTHRLHLSVPYASAIFADGEHETSGGTTAYADIAATCTLGLEGDDRRLPPQPTGPDGEILERQE